MKYEIKYKSFAFNVKDEDETGLTIEGYGATWNNIDSGGDMCIKGCATKTIKERGSRIAFCYQHDIKDPIGKILLIEEDEKGIHIIVKISASEEKKITKIKEKILQELSIGYRTIKESQEIVENTPVAKLLEIMIYEISLVTLAMNEQATITGMKSEQQINEIFDYLFVNEKRAEIQNEILKLKALVMTKPEASTLQESKPLTAKEILNLLSN